MQIFQYPYVIITILVIFFLIMGMIGLYFTMKSAKTAKGTVEHNFCGIGKIENDFEKAGAMRGNRCIVYISISLDSMKRLYPESRAIRMYEQIKGLLLHHFCFCVGGEISIYEEENYVALNKLEADQIAHCIDKCFEEINEVLARHGAVNVVHVNFGYHCTSATDISFQTALGRAKQACSIAEMKEILHCQWDSSNGREFERKIVDAPLK